jgi:hypothetical protein
MNTSVQIGKPAQGLPVAAPRAARAVAVARGQVDEFVLLVAAGALLLASLLLPYWQITLHAPQYPKGLIVQAYAYKLAGNVSEVDGLNHYIGMMKLGDAAVIERQIAPFAIPLIALLAVTSFWLPGVWRFLARVPIVIFPIVFAVDLFWWLYYAGHSLDPNAALSSSIDEFTPRITGIGVIGQFSTDANFMLGFVLAIVAAVMVLVISILRRSESNATG